MKRYRLLAQNRLDDYQLYSAWEKNRAPNEPEKSLKQLREILSKLETKGALSFRLADEEASSLPRSPISPQSAGSNSKSSLP